MAISYPNRTLPPSAVSLREHIDAEVVLWCRSGLAEVMVGGTPIHVPQGAALLISAGLAHEIVTTPDTVLVPAILGSTTRRAVRGDAPWILLDQTPAALRTMISTAHHTEFTRLNASAHERLLLHERIRAWFAHGSTTGDSRTHRTERSPLTGQPPLHTPWIEHRRESVLLWCQAGRGTIAFQPVTDIPIDRGRTLAEVRLTAGQAVLIPSGVPHRVSTSPGGTVTPVTVGVEGGESLGHTPAILRLPTRLEAAALHSAVAKVSRIRPAHASVDTRGVHSTQAVSEYRLDFEPHRVRHLELDAIEHTAGSSRWRVQTIKAALLRAPGHRATLADWGDRFGVSARRLRFDFASHSQQSFAEFREELRMRTACDLLDAGNQAKWVAHHLGFAHLSSFSRAFTRFTGVSARDHQAEAKGTVLRLR